MWNITISVLFILVCNNGFKLYKISTESTNSDGSIFRAKDAGANRSAPLARGHNAHHPPFSGSERQAMYHSMLIQGSPTNGTFERINPYKHRNPTITFITVLFRSNQVIFNNVDFTNVVANSNDEEITIIPGYYTINEIIAMLNTMTDTMFSISTKDSSYGNFWIQSPHTIDFTNVPDIRDILGL